MYTKATAENTIDFIEKILQAFPFPIQKIRTDNGKEFIAHSVRNKLKTLHIHHRTNTPYCPEENGKIERFHRTLKEKCIRPFIHTNLSQDYTQYKLSLFMNYYNYTKRHRGLGMNGLTPVQKLHQCASVKYSLQCYSS